MKILDVSVEGKPPLRGVAPQQTPEETFEMKIQEKKTDQCTSSSLTYTDVEVIWQFCPFCAAVCPFSSAELNNGFETVNYCNQLRDSTSNETWACVWRKIRWLLIDWGLLQCDISRHCHLHHHNITDILIQLFKAKIIFQAGILQKIDSDMIKKVGDNFQEQGDVAGSDEVPQDSFDSMIEITEENIELQNSLTIEG